MKEEYHTSPLPATPAQRLRSTMSQSTTPSITEDGLSQRCWSPASRVPTPAQRKRLVRPDPTSTADNDNNCSVQLPSFNFTPSECKSSPVRLQAVHITPVPLFPRFGIARAMLPPDAVLFSVPESSQFRPAPPTPAQRPQSTRRADQSQSHSPTSTAQGKQSKTCIKQRETDQFGKRADSGATVISGPSPSLPLPLMAKEVTTNRLTNAATAPSALMRAQFTRRVPPPPQPPPLCKRNNPPIVLAPNSDTSGTQSQPQSQSQSQSQSQLQSQVHRQDKEPQSLTESDSQPAEKPITDGVPDPFGDGASDDYDHDSLFSGADSDDLVESDDASGHGHGHRNHPEYEHITEDQDPIAEASLEVHPGGSFPGPGSGSQSPIVPTSIREGVIDLFRGISENHISSGNGLLRPRSPPEKAFSSGSTAVNPLGIARSREIRKNMDLEPRARFHTKVVHDAQAWSEPSFKRSMRTNVATGSAKTFRVGLTPATDTVGGEDTQNPSSEPGPSKKRQRSDNSTANDNNSKAKAPRLSGYTNVAGARRSQQDALTDTDFSQSVSAPTPPLKLGGAFQTALDDLPATEPGFLSWSRLQEIALKVGKTRSMALNASLGLNLAD